MKPPLKLLLSALSAGAIVALALFGWSVKAKNDATFHLADGVEITPLEVKQDDMALALDTRIWKFDVKPPTADKPYQETLAVCQHGKLLDTIGGFGIDPGKWEHLQVTICMTPVDGNLSEAQRIKYVIRGVIVGAYGPHGISMTESGLFANPVRGLEGGINLTGDGNTVNQVILFSGHDDHPSSPSGAFNTNINDISIVFQVEPLPNISLPTPLRH